jgi:hypothetical protein
MTRHLAGTRLPRNLLAIVTLAFAALGASAQSSPTAERLVQTMLDARKTSGFRVRAKLTRTNGGVEVSRNLLITGRRDGERTTVVYRVTGPPNATGHALLLQDAGDHQPSGARIDRSKIAPLTVAMLGEPFFDSDLRIEDVFESFWYWQSPRIVGEQTVGNRRCAILELLPPPNASTRYARVTAWIAIDLALPLRIELVDRDEARVTRLMAGRIVKRDGRWTAARLLVEPGDGRSRTVLEGSRFERDLVLPAADFTVNAIARAVRESE